MRALYPACLALIIASCTAYAAEDLGDLEVTIRMIDSKQGTDEFINHIELPKIAAERKAPPATEGASKMQQRPEEDSSGHEDRNRARNNRRDADGHDSDQSRRGNHRMDPSTVERPTIPDKAPRDSMRFPDRDAGSRERYEGIREKQKSFQESSRAGGK